MIYIDPPYNMGNNFVYEDDYTDPLQRYYRDYEVDRQDPSRNSETVLL